MTEWVFHARIEVTVEWISLQEEKIISRFFLNPEENNSLLLGRSPDSGLWFRLPMFPQWLLEQICPLQCRVALRILTGFPFNA